MGSANDNIANFPSISLSDGRVLVRSSNWNQTSPSALTTAGRVDIISFGSGSGDSLPQTFTTNPGSNSTITATTLKAQLDAGTAVTLQANNDITLSTALTVNNASGNGGDLTLQAGRSILLNANLTTGNGNLTLIANETAANGVVDANRDAGAANITQAAGTTINAGSGSVSIQLKDGAGLTNNTAGSITLASITSNSLSVDAANFSGSIAANNKVYDGTSTATLTAFSLPQLTFQSGSNLSLSSDASFADENVANGKTVTGTFAISGFNGAATSTILKNGVTLNATTTANVTPAPLTVTANNASKIYDAVAYSGGNGVSYSGFVNGETSSVLSGALSYGGTSQGAANAGTYGITPGGLSSGNYAITYVDGALTINAAAITTISGNLTGAVSKTYDGTNTATLNASNYLLSGWVGSDGATVTKTTGTYSDVNAGSNKTVTVSLTNADYSATGSTNLSNYSLPTSISGAVGTITKAHLTVTADNQSRLYGGANPTFTQTISGYVNGENATSAGLTGSASGSSTATPTTAVGSAVITGSAGTLAAANYDFAAVNGTLTVSPAPLTITANNASKTYGQSPTLTAFTTTGLQNGETVGSVIETSAGSSATASVSGGPYAIVPSAASGGSFNAGNYTITYVNGALTINRANATVTGNSASGTYTGLPQSVSGFTVSGLVNGESASVLSSPTASGATGTNAGSYTNTVSGNATDGNYSLTFQNSALTINPAPLIVTTNNDNKMYDGVAYRGGKGVTYVGFVNGEDHGVLGGQLQYAGDSQGATSTGSYAIKVSGLTARNYLVSFVDGSLVITPQPPVVAPPSLPLPTQNTAPPLTMTSPTEGNPTSGSGQSGGTVPTTSTSGNTTPSVTNSSPLPEPSPDTASTSPTNTAGTASNTNPGNNQTNNPSSSGTNTGTTAPGTGTTQTEVASNFAGTTETPPTGNNPTATTASVPASGNASANVPTSSGSSNILASLTTTAGITVSLVKTPAVQDSNVINVSVPKEMATAGAGFSFPLPAQVVESGGEVTATKPGGGALPSWLKFNAETNTFIATAVPDGSFPYHIMVHVGRKRPANPG